jgi:hypothetical protein
LVRDQIVEYANDGGTLKKCKGVSIHSKKAGSRLSPEAKLLKIEQYRRESGPTVELVNGW